MNTQSAPPRRILLHFAAIALMAVNAHASTAAPGSPEKLPLWPGQAPFGSGAFAPSTASLTIHLPEQPNGAALVICPGGGYGGLVTGAEGHGIAQWLNAHGIAGIVLEYRLPNGNSFLPLADAQRALRTVRARASEWHIQPDKIGIIGFSAGGHLASTAGTHFDLGRPAESDPVEKASCKPDFQVLIYPVITMGANGHTGSRKRLLGETPTDDAVRNFSNETQVTAQTPPAFLAHAVDDKTVPVENSIRFHEAMLAAGRPSKLVQLPSGGHGLNGYKGPMWDQWQMECLKWLGDIGVVHTGQ